MIFVVGLMIFLTMTGRQACSDGTGEIGANICDTDLRVLVRMCYSCDMGWAQGIYPMDSIISFTF